MTEFRNIAVNSNYNVFKLISRLINYCTQSVRVDGCIGCSMSYSVYAIISCQL